jgi:cytochrome P450
MFGEILSSWSLTWTFLLLVVVLVVVYIYYSCYVPHQYFKRMGVPGPDPTMFDGNVKYICSKGACAAQVALAEEYGPVVGYFIGIEPQLQVSDLDMIREISINLFSTSFTNRAGTNINMAAVTGGKLGLLQSRDDEWRRARKTLTPTFSAYKMKMMEPLIAQSTKQLVGKLSEVANSGKSVNMNKLFGKFTMEVILASAFGQYIDIQNSETENELTTAAAFVFASTKEGESFNPLVLQKWLSLLPAWIPFLLRTYISNSPAIKARRHLAKVAEKLVKQRRENEEKRQVCTYVFY